MAITGIGGVFFRAKDPDALLQWYKDHLGVTMVDYEPWQQAAGPTVFTPFASTTDYWPDSKQWMINFRVEDLAGRRFWLYRRGLYRADMVAAWFLHGFFP